MKTDESLMLVYKVVSGSLVSGGVDGVRGS